MKLDVECFKLQDPRIRAVQKGRMSLQALTLSIRPKDWLFQYKDTIYTLTQDQYYASQQLREQYYLSKDKFQEVMDKLPLAVSQKDNKQLYSIKQKRIGCSNCKYNSYKTRVKQILSNYPSVLEQLHLLNRRYLEARTYPRYTSTIVSKITSLLPTFFAVQEYTRTPCLDCVTKHIGMAYIKGCEAQKGYPQHLVLAIANLQEAYQECPSDMQFLKQNLMFCIGKSIRQKKAFVPLNNLLNLISLARNTTKIEQANISNVQDTAYQLVFSQQHKQFLLELDIISKMQLLREVQKVVDIIYADTIEQRSIKFQGQSGVLQDMFLPYSKDISNILRNRRLIFKYTPELMQNTQYDFKDLKQWLSKVNKSS